MRAERLSFASTTLERMTHALLATGADRAHDRRCGARVCRPGFRPDLRLPAGEASAAGPTSRPRSRLRRCPSTSSRRFRRRATSGLPATGPGTTTTTTGSPGSGSQPAQTGLLWTPGYWAFVGGAYLFHPGYWGPHVGFYGGVNYGYGYNGLGYEGGRWEETRFLQHDGDNFGGLRMTNVYTETVVAAPGAGRVSLTGVRRRTRRN